VFTRSRVYVPAGSEGLDYIKFQNHHYHVNWDISKGDIGQEFEIHFAVAAWKLGLSTTPGL